MTNFTRLSSYEAIRDPVSGAVVFTGTRGLQQAKARKRIVQERQKEQETIRELAKTVKALQEQVAELS